MNQSSEEWLKMYGIDYMKLTLKDLLSKGIVSKYVKWSFFFTTNGTIMKSIHYEIDRKGSENQLMAAKKSD